MENGRQEAQLTWISHPVREEPARTWIIVLFVALTAAAVWLYAFNGYWAALSAAVLLFAVREWFLPTRYLLDETGATRYFLVFRHHKPWREIKRLSPDRHGLLLSPFPEPSRLDAFRGLYLRFSGNREAVLDFAERRVRPER